VSRQAIVHLKRVDPVLAKIITRVGPYRPTYMTGGTHFDAIARSIVYQQLSNRAAATIYGRVHALYGGRAPTPQELLATGDEALRGAGLSRAKTIYVKDLAARAVAGTLPLERLHDMPDSEILEALTAVKGIGRWTAQMFMMFRLGRPDVLPELDLGLRKAVQLAYKLRTMPTPQQVLARGAIWSPYSSVAAWYLWRTLDRPDGSRYRRASKKKVAARKKNRIAPGTERSRPRVSKRRKSGKRSRLKRSRLKRSR
jgi:DNA-3-methyladenine glycosylase II